MQSNRDAAFRESGPSKAFRQNEHFHLVLNRANRNSALEKMPNLYNKHTILVRSFAFRSIESLQRSAKEHHGIIEADTLSDRNVFVEAILKHILGAKTSYLKTNSSA